MQFETVPLLLDFKQLHSQSNFPSTTCNFQTITAVRGGIGGITAGALMRYTFRKNHANEIMCV